MAEKDELVNEKVEYVGLFNFPAYYSYANSWYKDHDYDGVTEEKYSEKVSGNAKDILIEWKAVKRLSDFFKIEHKIKFEITGITEVEVEIEGKRNKMNKGKVFTQVKGYIIRDPDSKWDSSPFYRFLRDIYSKYIIPGRVDALETEIIKDVQEFKEDLKSFLELSGKR